MADITATGSSGYGVGEIDTATVLVNGLSPRRAQHVNGPASAAVQIESTLGSAVTLKGTHTNLSTRLAVALAGDGKLLLSTPSALSGSLGIANGGTGLTTIPAGSVVLGNGTSNLLSSLGLCYQGPSSIGSSSSRSHEGVATIAVNQALSGVHFYTDFTLNAGITATLGSGARHLVIIASNSITVNGTISAAAAGAVGGTGAVGAGAVGGDGTDQPAGNGGAGTTAAGSGGDVVIHGVTLSSGNTQLTGSSLVLMSNPLTALGGAAGGAGGGSGATIGGSGGRGGGSIVLIAPTITLGATAVLNTTGANGANGNDPAGGSTGGGGGGGGGNVYILCRSYTDSGATFTMTGGSGGSGFDGGATGSAGATGVKQILIYA